MKKELTQSLTPQNAADAKKQRAAAIRNKI